MLWRRGSLFRPATHLGVAALALLAILGGAIFGPLPSLAAQSTQIFFPAVSPQETVKTDIPQNRPRAATIVHVVTGGETLGALANKYNVSVNTIMWANNLSSDVIKPGQSLLIPPVTGVVHIIAANETLASVAKQHGVSVAGIRSFPFNDIPDNGSVTVGQILVIPNGEPADVVNPPAPRHYALASAVSSTPTITFYNGLSNSYPFGQCTYYVATLRHVPWLDNAGGWYRDAIAAGYAVGASPRPGAIMVSYEGNSLGHVAYVQSVNANGSFVVSEMNYYGVRGGGFGRVDYRTITPGSIYIVGFIY